MFAPSRDQVRRYFCEVWRKHRSRAVLEGLEPTAIDIVMMHPEYHALLETPATELDALLASDYPPERGETNPFLHLSLHLAIAEQLSIDQPSGIRAAFESLAARRDPHAALHALLECLGEAIWHAQRAGTALDAEAYVECVRRAGSQHRPAH